MDKKHIITIFFFIAFLILGAFVTSPTVQKIIADHLGVSTSSAQSNNQ